MKLLLIVVSIIGLAAVIGAVVVGTRTFDGTVVDKPYERGLAYDAAHHTREASGWNAEILNKGLITGKNDILISILDRNGKPAAGVEVSVMVSRPSTPSYDKEYKAVAEKGLFRITADLPLYGYWDAKVQVSDKAKTVTFEKRVYAAERKK